MVRRVGEEGEERGQEKLATHQRMYMKFGAKERKKRRRENERITEVLVKGEGQLRADVEEEKTRD